MISGILVEHAYLPTYLPTYSTYLSTLHTYLSHLGTTVGTVRASKPVLLLAVSLAALWHLV